jgi:hypothetical protein
MRRLVLALLSLIGLAVVLYVWFFVPLGRRTLHEHALRIAATDPARELGGDIEDASRRLVSRIESEWASRYAADAGAP